MYPILMLDIEIAPRDLAAKLACGAGCPVLLDVREPWECSIASIAGARAIPLGEITARACLELDPEAHIVVVCHSGVRSMNVTVWLRNQGFETVQSLRGGIDAWSMEVDSTVARY